MSLFSLLNFLHVAFYNTRHFSPFTPHLAGIDMVAMLQRLFLGGGIGRQKGRQGYQETAHAEPEAKKLSFSNFL